MTDDIVARLRDDYEKTVPLCAEAADEIERLRADLEEEQEIKTKLGIALHEARAELAAERGTVAAYITSSAKCEAKLAAANEALLAAEMMLSELGISADEKCQMAYDHLHRYRTSDE